MKRLFTILHILISIVVFSQVTNTNDSGAGSLRQSIADATEGDIITFDASLANQTITLSSTLEIPVGKNLTIDGQAAPNLSISRNNAVRVFLLNSTFENIINQFFIKKHL